MSIPSAALDWTERTKTGLGDYPTVQALLGDVLIRRAGEDDGLMNRLVLSACGANSELTLWEYRLKNLPAALLRPKAFASRFTMAKTKGALGAPFDVELDSLWAELTAHHVFASTVSKVDIVVLPTGKGRMPDFQLEWDGKTALVEVKRATGLAQELHWAEAAVMAARLCHPAEKHVGVVISSPEAYQLQRLAHGVRREKIEQVYEDAVRLLEVDQYRHLVEELTAGEQVVLGDQAIVLKRNLRGNDISTRLYAGEADGGLANAVASLKGVADVFLRVRDALEQLFANTDTFKHKAQYLVAYIYFDTWELGGLDLTMLNDAFAEILHWNPRLCIVIADSGDDHFYFGRNAKEEMRATTHFESWSAHLGS